MKTIILFCLTLLAGATAQAQVETETFSLKAVKKGEEPAQVMEAIKQDFPKAIVSNLSMLPPKLYGEHWSVALDDKLNGDKADFYMVNLKEGNETYKAVYDKDGKIKSSKYIVKQTELPSAVVSSVGSKYPGWTIIKDSEKITFNEGVLKEAYHVEAQKDKMYRSLFLDNSGKIVKDVLLKRSK